jgi:hypothetical protein
MTTTFQDERQRVDDEEHAEGPVARRIEQQTAKLPSDLFLWAALASMGVSLGLQLGGRRSQHASLFVGQWAPSLLLFGLYDKLVKVAGSDRTDRE